MNRPARLRDNRGSVAVELVTLAPLFGLLLMAVVAVGRVQNARADVEGAARMAARDLSIARDPHLQLDAAEHTAATVVGVGSPSCRTMAFDAVIEPDRIDVTVSCSADLQDAALLPLPGTMTVAGSAAEVRDAYREEAPP